MGQFDLTPKQKEEIKEWQDHIKAIYGKYGTYEYRFTPCEIGVSLVLFSNVAKIEKDFTDLDSW